MSDDKIARDAKTGEFVTAEYAEANPDTTVFETIELSDKDRDDLAALSAEGPGVPQFHTILEVWREVLKPAAVEGTKRPTPQWCNRMITSYPGVTHADMYNLRDSYFSKIQELLDILLEEIKADSDALTYTSPEEDVEHNSGHYRDLLTTWQVHFLQWELDWDCLDPNAAAEIAAVAEVHKVFFGQVGLTQFLDNIRFEYTEEDQAALAAALEATRVASEGSGE